MRQKSRMVRFSGDHEIRCGVRLPIILAILIALAPSVSAEELPRNAAAGVKYVGSEKCVECHKEQHASFLKTLHSKAARLTDPQIEPKPTKFHHTKSGNEYEIEIDGDQMKHREVLQNAHGEKLAITEFPVEITLGSGTNATSYLIRDGSFYVESPLTYFADDESWGMSPGYDEVAHRSFRRTVTVTCVFCHVGTISQKLRNPYKFDIVEKQIGCERCHGPGELHVKKFTELAATNKKEIAESDDTIVNPSHLSRELGEAICQQCHCQGVQAINLPGKTDWHFRPGMRLSDVRVDYQFRRGDQSMRLVGHVEQMHASKCYTNSETLTCISCHDPHDSPDRGISVSYYREKCFQCHQDEDCGQPLSDRVSANKNDCATCHMPRGDTNVSHFALHDHRIAVHKESVDRRVSNAADFAPILNLDHLTKTQRDRARSLAKYELHRRHGGNPNFANFQTEAIGELIQIKQAGNSDSDVDAALAWMAAGQGQTGIAESLAIEVVKRDLGEPMAKIVATNVLARLAFQKREFNTAARLYRALEQYHRDGQDAYFQGLSEQNMRNTVGAIHALNRSIEIEPSQVGAHAALAAIYTAEGKTDDAKRHAQAVEKNTQLQQRYRAAIEAKKAELRSK